jgi:hypothetical protein
MSPSPPLTVAEWREFLGSYSSEFLNSRFLREAEAEGRAQWMVSEVQRQTGWLGYEPASEEAVRAAEERLGIVLPPAYRNFLLASNGWSNIAYSVDLLKAEEIGWFAELEPQLLAAWSEPGMEHFAEHIRVLERCLLISNDNGGHAERWLLGAGNIAQNGEWTAYEWWPGAGGDPEPHDNFAALVASSWEHKAKRGR